MVKGIWRYLAATWNECTVMKYDEKEEEKTTLTVMNEKKERTVNNFDEYHVDVATDASFAPGGYRSRTGVVIKVGGHIIRWTTNRQTFTAASSCEA